MEIDQLVKDAFTAHEDLSPDEHEVMSAVQRRIRRRPSALVQPMAIAASVAVVAGTSVVAVLMSRDHRGASSGAQQPAASVSAPHRPARSTAPRPSSSSIHPLTMPFDVGWLPSGSVAYYARRINLGSVHSSGRPLSFDGEYLLSVTTPNQVIDIDVAQTPGGLDGVHFKSGAGAQVTINGRRGIESVHAGGPGGYEIYFQDSAGGTMYVNAGPNDRSPAPTAAELTAIGRQVAQNVTFPGTAQVAPSFNVGDLPGGLRVLAFEVGLGRTSYALGRSGNSDSAATVGIGSGHGLAGSTSGRTVQGHPTRYIVDHGYVSLYVLGAVNGNDVSVAGKLPLTQLYAIADGLVLPHR
jgi:hypothetical protein